MTLRLLLAALAPLVLELRKPVFAAFCGLVVLLLSGAAYGVATTALFLTHDLVSQRLRRR